MVTVMDTMNLTLKGSEKKCLDSHLWHACAGGMVQMPAVHSKVFYFPQGYAEHGNGNVEFGKSVRIPALILCRVAAIKYLADPETDEVYAKLGLVALRSDDMSSLEDGDVGLDKNGSESSQKPVSFAKTLTQSDANNGGGFSVPRYCAETIFPRLDYRAEPPVQTILAKDVHGEVWKFRHIYRGTPRRHLLTTGWSNFVNRKRLLAGDSIVFMRAENGDLCVGIRRAKRGIGGNVGGLESSCGWNAAAAAGNCNSPYGGYSLFLREDERANSKWCGGERGSKVTPESVIEAASLAATGQPFEVVYYPRASSPEFCVKASAVTAAMQIQWCSGMRFKMPFETEDSSRVSWFMGTISSVQVADPIHWPNSPWRLLQVTWDEPDLLQNVKRVSPWLVELVSNLPGLSLSPFAPPRKRLRLPQHADFSLLGQIPMPSFSSSTSCYTPPSIQGARHAHVGLSLSDVYFNHLQTDLPPRRPHPLAVSSPTSKIASAGLRSNHPVDENISCLLTMGSSSSNIPNNSHVIKTPQFVLFGQPILTQDQISQSCSNDTSGNTSSDGSTEKTTNTSEGSKCHWLGNCGSEGTPNNKDHQNMRLGMIMDNYKVLMDQENAGTILDLSVLGSHEQVYRQLAGAWHKKIRDADQYAVMAQDAFR